MKAFFAGIFALAGLYAALQPAGTKGVAASTNAAVRFLGRLSDPTVAAIPNRVTAPPAQPLEASPGISVPETYTAPAPRSLVTT